MINPIEKKTTFLQVILIVILGVIIYINCSDGGFIWDDHGLIQDNEYIKSWSSFPIIISTGFGAGGNSGFYRPLQSILQMSGYSWWGLQVTGYHLISIFTHILAAVIFYFFLRNIFQDKKIAFLASLLFLSSPINTEAVCYISGLSDPLALVFMLACLIFYLKSITGKNTNLYFLALICFILALLSKENAVVLPLLVLLYHYAFGIKPQIKKLLPIFAVLSGYILLRLFVLSPPELLGLTVPVLWSRVPVFFAGITEYLRIILLPFNLHVEYASQLFRFTDPKVILGAIWVFLLVVFSFFVKKSRPGLFFAGAWFLITLIPVSNIYPISQAFIMEHYLYVPALGFFMFLAILLNYPVKNGVFAFFLRLFIISLLLLYSFLTLKQTSYWKYPLFFYKRTLQYAPESWRFYNELGIEYADAGNHSEAETAYQEALNINPDAAGVYHNLINLYKKTGDREKLWAVEKTANASRTRLSGQYSRMASELQAVGRYAEGLLVLKQALELDQKNLNLSNDLASAYVLTGKYQDAVALLRRILVISPDSALAYNNLAVAHYYLKQYDLAIENINKAIIRKYPVEPELIELLKPYNK